MKIRHGSKGGWDIFGIERRVTRSEGHVLYELDGRPALQLYKEYLGERAAGLPATAMLFPLALRADPSDTKSIVRTALDIDEANDAMIFAGDIPQGYLAQLMRANFDRLIDGASEAALMTRNGDAPNTPVLLDDGYLNRVNSHTFPTTWFLDRQVRKAFEKIGWSEKLVEEFSWRLEDLRVE